MEANHKIINNLIINKLAAGDTLDSADSAALESIFSGHWITEGMSVYSAAAILAKEYYPPEISARQVQPEALSIQEPKNQFSAPMAPKVFPNPANDRLFINDMTEGRNEIEIYDAYGRLIIRKKAFETNHSIELKGIINGIYFIRIENDEKNIFYQRFVLLKK